MFPKLNSETEKIEPEVFITDEKSAFYEEYKDAKQSPPYNIMVFEDIGRAFCIGVLDYIECNPISRIPLSIYKTLEGVKKDILLKIPIFIPKKKEEEQPDKLKKIPKPFIAKKQIRSQSTQRAIDKINDETKS